MNKYIIEFMNAKTEVSKVAVFAKNEREAGIFFRNYMYEIEHNDFAVMTGKCVQEIKIDGRKDKTEYQKAWEVYNKQKEMLVE